VGTKTKKELTAVVSVYPVVMEKEAAITEEVLPSQRTKAKRKLVSNLFVVLMKRNDNNAFSALTTKRHIYIASDKNFSYLRKYVCLK